MIKYLGSKRRLVPILEDIAAASGASNALDLFTGTTRVAQGFKRRGLDVTAVDTARYSEIFAQAYVATDRSVVDVGALDAALADLNARPGRPGYFTETFCVRSRFVQPFNGARVDAIRDAIETEFADSPLRPLLLTSLIEATDRVDSTTGVQMAYVKTWAPRSFRALDLRRPELLAGAGTAIRADAAEVVATLGDVDLAYLDPPYNQHRYFTNYHVWETLVAWDHPEHYGVACKRIDARDPHTKSPFNSKRTMPTALSDLVRSVPCRLLVLSYNDEAWITLDELMMMCERFERVVPLSFGSPRYVGARIGIHNPSGEKVGTVSHVRNHEYLIVAGESNMVSACTEPLHEAARHAQRSLRRGA
jgi:adenine-specific DNA-methyltransferase